MTRLSLGLAFALAIAPALLLWRTPELGAVFESVSVLGLGLLAAFALVSLPRPTMAPRGARDRGPGGGAAREAALDLLQLGPAVSLCAWLDLRAGAEGIWERLGVGALGIFLLAFAAALSRRGGSIQRALYGVYWFGVVVGLPLLAASRSWAGLPTTAAAASYPGLHLPVEGSLLPWALGEAARGPGGVGPPQAVPWVGLGVALLAVVLFGVFGRRGPRRSAGAVALASIAVLGLAPSARGENRLYWCELDLVGPLSEVRLELPRGGATRVSWPLAAGEIARLDVPLAYLSAEDQALLGAPIPQVVGAGEARVRPAQGDPGAAWRALPRSLAARPRPLDEGLRPGPEVAPLALALVFGALVVLGPRRGRGVVPAIALFGALGSGWILWHAVAGPSEARGGVRVLELGPGGHSVEVWASAGGGEAPRGPVLRLEVVPTGANFGFWVRREGSAMRFGVEGLGPGGQAVWFTPGGTAPGELALGPAANRLEDLLEGLWRSPAGLWHAHGPWAEGAPPPLALWGADAGPGRAPTPLDGPELAAALRPWPGWLVGALPQGTGVLVARLRPGQEGERRWLRASPLP